MTIVWIMIGVAFVAVIVWLVLLNKRNKSIAEQYSKEVEECEQKDLLLTETLHSTKQHLKYQKDVKLIYLTNWGILLFHALMFLALFFLPIFQIKAELFSATLAKEKFSLYANFQIMKGNRGISTIFWLMIALIALLGFELIDYVIFKIRKVFCNSDSSALNAFKNIWFYNRMNVKEIEHYWGGQKYDIPRWIEIFGSIAITILAIVVMKKVDIPNNFTLCNGVSGYLAIPIICLFATIGLVVLSYRLQKNLKTKIKNEVVDLPKPEEESPQTAEASGAENQAEGTPQNAEEATPQSEEGETVNTPQNDEADLPKSEEVGPPKTEE